MPALIDAVSTYATLGEVMATLGEVFGRHVEVPTIYGVDASPPARTSSRRS